MALKLGKGQGLIEQHWMRVLVAAAEVKHGCRRNKTGIALDVINFYYSQKMM